MTKSLTAIIGAFFKAHDADVAARSALIDAVKAARIKSEDKLRPVLVEAAAKHYSVALVTSQTGKTAGQKTLSRDDGNYEAAKKAVSRALAKVATELGWREEALASRDPVPSIISKIEKLDGRVLRRLVSTMKEKGLIK